MLKKFALNKIRQIYSKVIRVFIISIILGIFTYALPEIIETPLITDKLLQSIYYGGRKINKVTYEELKKNPNQKDSNYEFNTILENYYSDYLYKVANDDFVVDNNKVNTVDRNVNSKVNYTKYTKNEKDEKIIFSKSMYNLYGNKTIFNMDLQDLEKLVHSTILSDGEAVLFWESLLQLKTDRAKSILGRVFNEVDHEVYLFNIIGMKAWGIVFFTIIVFLITHKIQLSVIKFIFIYNLICTVLTYYLIEHLYRWKYYLASSIMFLQFGFCLKYMLDSIMNNFGYNKEDYDILLNISKTKTILQFTLKLGITLIITIILGYISLVKFTYFFNYIMFYICLIQMMYLISFFLQYEAPAIFQPFKHFLLIILGIVNFLLTNFHRKISKFNNRDQYDSFYIVSETFSFVCISYLYEFLLTQANSVAHFFCDKSTDPGESNKKASSFLKNIKEHQKNFGYEDTLWIAILFFGIFFTIVGVYNGRYLTFLFSLQYIKVILKVFGSLFSFKILRIVYSIIIFFLVIANHITTEKNDVALFEACSITIPSTISFIKFFARLAGIVFIILTIIVNFEFIVIMQEKKVHFDEHGEEISEQFLRTVEVSTTYEKKNRKKIKKIEIQIVREETVPLSFMNIIYMHFDFYTNYFSICIIFYFLKEIEKNHILILFYGILVSILITRIYFVINEFKNSIEFSYAFMISFFMGIRLITISINNPVIYFMGCLYLFILVVFYCMSDRRRLLITVLVFFHLYSACIYLTSNYLLILIIALICLPITLLFDENKYTCSVLRFFFPGLIIMFLQLYGFKNIFTSLTNFNSYLLNLTQGFDLISYVQNIVQGKYINEYAVMEWIFTKICQVFEIKFPV